MASQVSMTGRRDAAGVAPQAAAGDGQLLGCRQPLARRNAGRRLSTGRRAAPYSRVFALGSFFSYYSFLGLLWVLLGDEYRQFQVRFNSQKLHQGGIKQLDQDYFGLYLDSSLWNHAHQLIKPKFSFSSLYLLLVCSYLFYLRLLIQFIFSLNVQFLY